MTAPVLIMGQGLTLLGTVRCFGRAQVPAYVLTGPDQLAGPSRWFRPWPGPAVDSGGYDALGAALAKIDLAQAVLVPCSDRWAAAVGKLGAELEARFPSVVSPAAAIETLVDKGRFAAALTAVGIPHPRTYELMGPEDLAAVPDEVLAGGFLKPRDSVAFFGAFGRKALDFQGRNEAEAALDRTRTAGLAMLLQEYIPGPADRHYFLDGVAARGGGFSVLFARRRLRIYPPRFGNSTAMISVPLAEVRDAVTSLEALAPHVGLRGIFSAEFKLDPRDGRFKLIEVNPRPWWYVEFAATCGADVCVPAYRDALGLPAAPAPSYRVGVRLAYPYHDWPAWRASTSSLAGLLRFWCGATQPEWRRDDPRPGIVSLATLARGWVRRRLPGRSRGTSP